MPSRKSGRKQRRISVLSRRIQDAAIHENIGSVVLQLNKLLAETYDIEIFKGNVGDPITLCREASANVVRICISPCDANVGSVAHDAIADAFEIDVLDLDVTGANGKLDSIDANGPPSRTVTISGSDGAVQFVRFPMIVARAGVSEASTPRMITG